MLKSGPLLAATNPSSGAPDSVLTGWPPAIMTAVSTTIGTGWTFDDAEFEATAISWENDDWAPISIHAYLQRWGEAAGAAEHEDLEKRLLENPPIRVPTVMLQGADDADNFPETSEGKERFFVNPYQIRVLRGVGHFIPREAPDEVLIAIRQLLSDTGASDVRPS
ncbi:MAG: alpha/beta hydrolase [Mesorhizobium sp.]|uniref:alpha/beta fold hydrolase n=1 Tax=Mesorhizobium sp. TaxID=1871066 RepID=UPI000FE8CF07|nr:alpha/beta hydrolase [Mesorhizobium sp.]RWL81364.1 MAG: alpha/beta hydrolase [Mesorhizobium sp.]